MPKSSSARSPPGVRRRLLGWGSPWKNPSSEAILKMASAPMEATRRRSEGESTSGRMSLNLVPSMYSSVSTLEVEIAFDPARRLGPLHLDGHGLPATQHGPVDLPDARRAERHRVERGEQLIDGSPELALDNLLGKPCRHGRSRVLEFLELGEYSFRQNVRACGEDLPELDEGRSQIVEGAPQPDTEVGREELLQALLLPPVPPDVEDEAEAMAHENAADLGEAPEVPRPGGLGDPSIRHARVLLLQSRRRLGGVAALGRGLRFACRRRSPRGTILDHPHPVLQLLDAEEKVLIVLSGRKSAPPETLLQRGVDQRSRPRRALAGAVHHVVDHRAALFALDAALLDERVHDLLHPVPRRSSCTYLQQDQTLQRLAYRSAHNYLQIIWLTTYMITKAQAVWPRGSARYVERAAWSLPARQAL